MLVETQQEQDISMLEEIEKTSNIEDPAIIELLVPKKFNLRNVLDLQDLARECISQGIEITSKIEHETVNGQFAIIGSELYFNGNTKAKNTSKGAYENGFYEKLESMFKEYKNNGVPESVETRKSRPIIQETEGLKRGKLSKTDRELIISSWDNNKGMSIKDIARMMNRKEEFIDKIIDEVRV